MLNKEWVGCVVGLIVLNICAIWFSVHHYPLMGAAAHEYSLKGVSDKTEGGDSDVLWLKQKGYGVEYSYVLGKARQWKYAGVEVLFAEEGDTENCFNMSQFDSLKMKVSSQFNKGFTLQIRTTPSDRQMNETSRVLNKVIAASPELTDYSIGLDDFYIPEWYKLNFKLPASGMDMSLGCVSAVQLLSSNYLEANVVDTVLWDEVYLIDERTWPRPLALGVTISSILFFILWIVKRETWKKAVQSNVLSYYKEVEVQSVGDQEWNSIREYFALNYSESDFQLSEAARNIGVTQKKLSQMVRDHLQMSAREYLNELRLKEGTRLLKESDLAINKIAYDVGYNSVAHFNRQFKSKYEVSPKVYRAR